MIPVTQSEIDRELPTRTAALDVDFYSPAERGKGDLARFTVARFEWRGTWVRVRRLSGPMKFEDARTELARQSRRLGIPKIGDLP